MQLFSARRSVRASDGNRQPAGSAEVRHATSHALVTVLGLLIAFGVAGGTSAQAVSHNNVTPTTRAGRDDGETTAPARPKADPTNARTPMMVRLSGIHRRPTMPALRSQRSEATGGALMVRNLPPS